MHIYELQATKPEGHAHMEAQAQMHPQTGSTDAVQVYPFYLYYNIFAVRFPTSMTHNELPSRLHTAPARIRDGSGGGGGGR